MSNMTAETEFIKKQGFGNINDSLKRPINIEIANVAYLLKAYSQQLYDDNVQLKKQNKQLRKFVTKFHNWIFERDTERIYKMLDELKINAEQLLKPK